MSKTVTGHIRGSPVLAAIVASGMTAATNQVHSADSIDAAQLEIDII